MASRARMAKRKAPRSGQEIARRAGELREAEQWEAAEELIGSALSEFPEVIDLAAIVITAGLLFFVLTDLTGAPRVLFTAAFTFFAPGRAVVSNWSQMAVWADLAMSIAISLGLLALLAMIALWLRAWHPESLFVAEALLSLLDFIRSSRQRHSTAILIDLPAVCNYNCKQL